jgi:putative ABC transport system permease protein
VSRMSWLRGLLQRRRVEREIDDELAFHVEMEAQAHIGRGMDPVEARRTALSDFGGTVQAKEMIRDVRTLRIESVWQDIRYAVRSLRKSPGFALAAILTLGLGIGLNVSLFTVFNVLALQTWDVQSPREVVLPFARPVGKRIFSNWLPYAEYVHLRDQTQTLSAVVARQRDSGRVFQAAGTDYDRAHDYAQFDGVSANFFAGMGIQILHGRGFLPDEDALRAPASVAVVTHDFWQNQLGADPNVVGRTLWLGVRNVPVTVVGVTRRGFSGVERMHPVSLFIPLSLLQQVDSTAPKGGWVPLKEAVGVAGRLRPDSSREAAAAELDALSRQFRASAGLEGDGLVLTGTSPIAQPGATDRFMPAMGGLAAAVLFVLLLACANVGNLQLARALARQREIAVRLSLGASRGRVLRQLLTEAGCIAVIAGGFALGLAWLLPRVLLRLARGEEQPQFVPDGTVVVVALMLGAGSALLFALGPALRATRATASLALRARSGMDSGGRRLRAVLLASQVALSLTLLTAAGLLTRGVLHAYHVDFGFEASRIAVGRIQVPEALYTRAALTSIRRELDERLARSDVGPTALTNVAPLDDSAFIADVRKPGEADTWNVRALERTLSPSGFELLGLAFVTGGPYSGRDEVREAVINETLARQLWPGENATGRTVLADDQQYIVTGVVRDTFYTTPATVKPVFHRSPDLTSTNLLFRTDQRSADAAVRAIVQTIDPRLRLTIAPVMANVEQAVVTRRFVARITWAVAFLGLALATVGVFGVFAYAVEERRREIGVRLALGARARDIFRALFGINRWSLGGGVVIGLLMSVVAGFVLRGYLFGLSPLDPVAYLGVSALIASAAVMATSIPARRALRVDPAVTLKAE